MISEQQVFNAKVFLRSYKEALVCIQQSVVKNATFDQFRNGMLEATENHNEDYLKLFKFSRNFLNKNFTPEPTTASELYEILLKIKEIPEFK